MTVRLTRCDRDRAAGQNRRASTRSISTSSIQACRSRPRARSASRRSAAGSRRSCACRSSRLIQRVLDGGALGIIVPDVRSAAQAREAVRAAKYPPLGERGFATALPHFQYRSLPAKEAYPALDAATMVIVQFESAEAIDRAEEIFAVDGVDMALFGTNDLTADMGIPGDYDNSARARRLCARHCGGEEARQARRRRRACVAPEAHRRVRQDGCALRLDRHRSRLPARAATEVPAGAGAGDLALT